MRKKRCLLSFDAVFCCLCIIWRYLWNIIRNNCHWAGLCASKPRDKATKSNKAEWIYKRRTKYGRKSTKIQYTQRDFCRDVKKPINICIYIYIIRVFFLVNIWLFSVLLVFKPVSEKWWDFGCCFRTLNKQYFVQLFVRPFSKLIAFTSLEPTCFDDGHV